MLFHFCSAPVAVLRNNVPVAIQKPKVAVHVAWNGHSDMSPSMWASSFLHRVAGSKDCSPVAFLWLKGAGEVAQCFDMLVSFRAWHADLICTERE